MYSATFECVCTFLKLMETASTLTLARTRVRLLLFAVLRDIVGTDRRELTLPEGTSATEVWESLRRDHPQLQPYTAPPLTAINMTYASPDTILREGDELAFIPPVSGG